MSRVVLGMLAGVAVGGSAAGWLAPRSSADDPPVAPAPRATPEPVAADPQQKKLERLEAALVREVEAKEQQLKRLAADGGTPDGRVARLRARADEQDAAVHAVGRDIARAEAERAALTKQLADAAKHDPEAVAARVRRDPRVAEVESARANAADTLARLETAFSDPANRERSPAVLRARAESARFEKHAAEMTKVVTADVEEALTKKATGATKADIAKLDVKLATDADARDRMRAELDALRKALAAAEADRFEADKLLDELKPLREALAKVRLDRIRLRVEQEANGAAKKE
jgi:chromosome segregation ATPase